jgi:hypothetical protein
MPLITLQEARSYIGLPNEKADPELQDLVTRVVASALTWLNIEYWAGASALSVYCDQSDATAATAAVSDTEITLVITGGAAVGSSAIEFATYSTLADVVTQINGLTGWTATLIGSGAIASSLLWEFAASSVFEIANVRILDYGLTKTAYFDGHQERDKLFLNTNPVTSVTSLHDDPERAYGSDTLLDSDDYVVYDWGIQLDGFKFFKGYKNIQVIYVGGYTPTTREDALVNALLRTISYAWNRRKSEHLSSDNVADLNIATTYMTSLPKDIKNAYAGFRRLVI